MKIETGKKMKPLAVMAHGERGTGKTNLPIEAFKAVWVGNEETDEYDVARMPKIEFWEVANPKSPNAEAGFINQLKWLLTAEHDFKTVVIDTMDGLETIAEKKILETANGKTMATAFGGYGKAYEKMSLMFLIVRDDYLVPLRDKRGMNVVILCHSEKYKVEDPMTSTAYDRFQTALHKSIKPIFEDWVSAIFFVSYQLFKAENQAGKEHAVGSGARVIYTEERPSHVAKNRFSLPYEIPYTKTGTWANIGQMIKTYFGGAPKFVAPLREEVAHLTVDQDHPINTVLESSPAAAEIAKSMETTAPTSPAPLAAVSTSEFNQQDWNDACKYIEEVWAKIPEDSKPNINLSISRAGKDSAEMKRIASKIEKIIQ